MSEITLLIGGYVLCMISDVFFSIANYFVQKAFAQRALRKSIKDGTKQ